MWQESGTNRHWFSPGVPPFQQVQDSRPGKAPLVRTGMQGKSPSGGQENSQEQAVSAHSSVMWRGGGTGLGGSTPGPSWLIRRQDHATPLSSYIALLGLISNLSSIAQCHSSLSFQNLSPGFHGRCQIESLFPSGVSGAVSNRRTGGKEDEEGEIRSCPTPGT